MSAYQKTKTRFLCIPFGIASLFLQNCFVEKAEAQQAVYHKISAEEAYRMMSELPDYILLDVRTEEEYKERRIAGAVLIPDYEVERRAEKELPGKNTVILVYCRSGRRSEASAKKLVSMGYENVYDFGGIMQWPYGTISD